MKFKLGDLCEFQKGYAFKSKDFVDNGEYIVKVTNLTNDSVEFMNCVKISYEKAEEYKKYELNNKDIIITTVGSWPNNPNSIVGKVVRVPNIKKKAFLNQNAVRVRGVNINQDFLYYLLRDKKFSGYLIGTAQGSASQASINQKDIKDYTVDIPDNNEQKAIAKILSDLDEKIEVNNKINKNLEEMAQAIFKQWFVDFEFPNEEGKPYKSSGGEMVESELGMIPKGWSINKISEISEIKNGVNYSRNQEGELVKVINVRDFNGSLIVNDNSLDNIYLQQKQIDDYKLKKFDTVIVRSAKPGETILVDNDEIKVYSGFTIRVRTKKQSNKLYIFYCLRNSMKKIENSSNGTIFKNLNQRILGALNFAMPSEKILLKYNNLSEIIIEQISMKTKENERLEKLRDTLLPKLMSGEIRVPLENSKN
ncbi:MAG: restriction endonuclease subunit S [Clostridium perfringens]|uniref:restriction endonuclease subunit S n=1 Tax=Clostridium perfringens TaxID=1502 RepID=UPI001158FDAD|nr:restriction endonuclease subunit S [Clostridium perfringens]MDM1011937.1 restriction endonuclease subunit S [Clostridium perfringens]MDU4219962.1 restriction endonuclease subunit S [Clostridium perfringens]MDU5490384.1 restriction endonuclease subunit S [Clostridium perfringens]